MDINLTTQSFATWPVGIAIVWALMSAVTRAFPDLTTRFKMAYQVGLSLLYSIVATVFFIDGSPKEMVQKGVILFLMVAFSQTAIYDGTQKLRGVKGDNQPATQPYKDYGDQGGGDNVRV